MGNMVANINIIVATAFDNVIGNNNDLPWDLPTDLKRFKDLTEGHTVVMGRNTWESIPDKFRPLPNRINVVITSNKDYVAEGAEVRHDFLSALNEFAMGTDELFVIGGGQIYKEAFKYANKLFITKIQLEVEGDTKLEGLVEEDWLLVGFDGHYEDNGVKFHFEEYKRK